MLPKTLAKCFRKTRRLAGLDATNSAAMSRPSWWNNYVFRGLYHAYFFARSVGPPGVNFSSLFNVCLLYGRMPF